MATYAPNILFEYVFESQRHKTHQALPAQGISVDLVLKHPDVTDIEAQKQWIQ